MKQKVKQSQIKDYLNFLRDSKPPGLAIANSLMRQGYNEVEINRYLQTQGTSEEEVLNIIRELNRK